MKNKLIFILKVLVLILLFIWIVIVFSDYFRVVHQGKNPMFCLSTTVKNYDDGSTTTCVGFGYKSIKYDRTCLNATEFGPFVIKERQCD